MKPCHENNDAAIYVGRATTVQQSFVLMFTPTVEYLNRDASIGQLLHGQGQKY